MNGSHRLSAGEFAAWQRTHRVALPYPLDLSGVATSGVRLASEPSALRLVRAAASAPRVSCYLLHTGPHAVLRTVVAVAAEDTAVLIAVEGRHVEIIEVASSELVVALADWLPDLVPLAVPVGELPEPAWADLLRRISLARSGPDRRTMRAALVARGMPSVLADAIVLAAATPTVVGVAGIQVWSGGSGHFGPSLVSWQELPDGALATHICAPRRPGPARVVMGPYHRSEVIASLLKAISTALYRHRPREPRERHVHTAPVLEEIR